MLCFEGFGKKIHVSFAILHELEAVVRAIAEHLQGLVQTCCAGPGTVSHTPLRFGAAGGARLGRPMQHTRNGRVGTAASLSISRDILCIEGGEQCTLSALQLDYASLKAASDPKKTLRKTRNKRFITLVRTRAFGRALRAMWYKRKVSHTQP